MKVLAAAMNKENYNPNKVANDLEKKSRRNKLPAACGTWVGTVTHMDFI